MIFVSVTNKTKYNVSQKLVDNIFKECENTLKLKSKWNISLVFCGVTLIRKINKKYRKKDKPTDVLSFDYKDNDGEIFICVEIAKNNAKKYKKTIKHEISELIVHGFLHILRYDHEKSDAKAKTMFKKQKEILGKLGYK